MIHPDQIRLGEISILTQWTCPPTVGLRDAVYQSGPDTVDKADSSDINKMPCIGIVTQKIGPTLCLVTRQGVVNGFPPATFVPKQTMYVGASGGLIDAGSLPSTPGSVIHEVGFAKSDQDLVVLIDRDFVVNPT